MAISAYKLGQAGIGIYEANDQYGYVKSVYHDSFRTIYTVPTNKQATISEITINNIFGERPVSICNVSNGDVPKKGNALYWGENVNTNDQPFIGKGITLSEGDYIAVGNNNLKYYTVDITDGVKSFPYTSLRIDDDRVLTLYGDSTGNSVLYGRVLTRQADGTYTVGTVQTIAAGVYIPGSTWLSATMIATDKAAIAYVLPATAHDINSVVLTFSGDVITVGSPVQVFANGSANNIGYIGCVAKLDTNKYLVYAQYASGASNKDRVAVKAATVSGTVPTFGTEATVYAGDASLNNYYIAGCSLDTDKALLVYTDQNASEFLKGIVATVSGTTVTLNPTFNLNVTNNERTYFGAAGIVQTGIDNALLVLHQGPTGNGLDATGARKVVISGTGLGSTAFTALGFVASTDGVFSLCKTVFDPSVVLLMCMGAQYSGDGLTVLSTTNGNTTVTSRQLLSVPVGGITETNGFFLCYGSPEIVKGTPDYYWVAPLYPNSVTAASSAKMLVGKGCDSPDNFGILADKECATSISVNGIERDV